MNWVDVASNQAVSWDSLLNACQNEVFDQLLPIPPSGTSAFRCIRRELIQSYVNIQSAPLAGVPNNELVVKSQVVAAQTTYYRVIGCFNQQYYYTKTPPGVPTVGRRYKVDAGSGVFFYFTWDGTSFFGDRPSNYFPGLVVDGRFIGCP